MKKNMFKNLIAKIGSKYASTTDKRMFYKQILDYHKSAPDLSDLIWDTLQNNFDLRMKHGSNFKVVSLGWSCMPRTLTTFTMLKAGKKAGEKSMPFDLAGSPPKAVAHFLRTDFSDYFTGKWWFNKEGGYWANDPSNGAFYAHDKDCGENDLEKIVARYTARIENLREALNFPGAVLFVMHKATHLLHTPIYHNKLEDFEEVCREIKAIRGDKPFKVLLFACDHNETETTMEGGDLIRLPWPDAKYIWHLAERYTPEGVKFEMDFSVYCRNAIRDMLQQNGLMND